MRHVVQLIIYYNVHQSHQQNTYLLSSPIIQQTNIFQIQSKNHKTLMEMILRVFISLT